ncbi:acyltransferase domain-containing protein, partial [Micromonospora humida]|uniref:acyltransferase domain-containing protein n=1 Tax=Micromonospora humida TaxID=2809018 RepID=UPI003429021D
TLRGFVASGVDVADADLGHSLASTRAALRHRAAVRAGDRAGMLAALDALAAGDDRPDLVVGRARTGRVVFVFPGQGSQWEAMARGLYADSAVFRDRLDECADALAAYTDWDLRDVLLGGGGDQLARVDVVQPVLFAVMVSLAALWRAHGVEPDAVVGHSQGEIAAAYVAGALTLSDAARVVALRSRAIRALAGTGAMASVALSAERLLPVLEQWSDQVAIGAINGPDSTVLSGAVDVLPQVLAELTAQGVRCRAVPVDYASHSPQVEAIRDDVLDRLAPITPTDAPVTFYSAVTGTPVDTAGLDAAYWYRNLRQTVRFEPAAQALLDDGYTTFIECSPHPVLAVGLRETFAATGQPASVVPTLRRDDGGLDRFRHAVGHAYVVGAPVDWTTSFPGARRISLPTYEFQRRPFWIDAPAATPVVATVRPGAEADAPVAEEPVGDGVWASELRELPAERRLDVALELVRRRAAGILGHPDASDVDPATTFKELGFSSLTVVELRDRLADDTALPLPSSLAYDFPSPVLVAERLVGLVSGVVSGVGVVGVGVG